jgi:hypothetical protein
MEPFVPQQLPIKDVAWEPLIPIIGRANRAIARYDVVLHAATICTLTQGRGSFTMHFERYEAVPYSIAEEIIAARTKAATKEE